MGICRKFLQNSCISTSRYHLNCSETINNRIQFELPLVYMNCIQQCSPNWIRWSLQCTRSYSLVATISEQSITVPQTVMLTPAAWLQSAAELRRFVAMGGVHYPMLAAQVRSVSPHSPTQSSYNVTAIMQRTTAIVLESREQRALLFSCTRQ
jgi:hypothetical protein